MALEPIALETLRTFLEQPRAVLDKTTVNFPIWTDVAAEGTGLARNISRLRKTLEGDTYHYNNRHERIRGAISILERWQQRLLPRTGLAGGHGSR